VDDLVEGREEVIVLRRLWRRWKEASLLAVAV
jgi:hypothetical protein